MVETNLEKIEMAARISKERRREDSRAEYERK